MGFIPIKAPFGGNISGTFSQIPTSKSKVSLREVFGVYIYIYYNKQTSHIT